MVISCEALSIILLVWSLELGGAGGKRILSPNKCFFFLTSFPDMNLEEKDGAVRGAVTATPGADGNSRTRKTTYMLLLLFKASRTFSYRSDLGVLASCKYVIKAASAPNLAAKES